MNRQVLTLLCQLLEKHFFWLEFLALANCPFLYFSPNFNRFILIEGYVGGNRLKDTELEWKYLYVY